MKTSLYLKVLLLNILTSLCAIAQPRSDLAYCHLDNGEAFKIVFIASEMDVYSLENISGESLQKMAISPNSFWYRYIGRSYIHDYSYKFGQNIKSEASDGYFLMLTPVSKNILQLSMHRAEGLKSTLRSINCKKAI